MPANKEQAPELVVADKLVRHLRKYWEEIADQDDPPSLEAVLEAFKSERESYEGVEYFVEDIYPPLSGLSPEGLIGAIAVVINTSNTVEKYLGNNDRLGACKALAWGYTNLGMIHGLRMHDPVNFASQLANLNENNINSRKYRNIVEEYYTKRMDEDPLLTKDAIAEEIYDQKLVPVEWDTIRNYLKGFNHPQSTHTVGRSSSFAKK
jgi:hypothetical protein